jgi:hypothetical protein
MSERLTDKRAVFNALHIAIDSEKSLVDAYKHDKNEPSVQAAERNITAFKRVLKRYYGSEVHPLDKQIAEMPAHFVTVTGMLKGFSDERG